MGNCTSSDVKSQALDSHRVQETRTIKRELKELFDEKKGEGVAPEAVGEAQKDLEEAPQLGQAVADAVADAAVDVVSDTPESAEATSESEHQGIAALRRVSPRAHGLSLLQAAGETPADAEPQAAADDAAAADVNAIGDAAGDAHVVVEEAAQEKPSDAVVDAVADAVGDDAPEKVSASKLAVSKLAVETDTEPQAATTRELECESPASPAAWVPDNSTKACQCCESDFTFVRRRHHCRACGQVVCNSCSSSRKVVADMGHTRPVRCCDRCAKAEH
eukprot:Hpha_TRINITY_DN16222_c1_g8::TRINITY_DN16222_c1_g8_i1::g.11279::m.11279